jgi:hypothetical protein
MNTPNSVLGIHTVGGKVTPSTDNSLLKSVEEAKVGIERQ